MAGENSNDKKNQKLTKKMVDKIVTTGKMTKLIF